MFICYCRSGKPKTTRQTKAHQAAEGTPTEVARQPEDQTAGGGHRKQDASRLPLCLTLLLILAMSIPSLVMAQETFGEGPFLSLGGQTVGSAEVDDSDGKAGVTSFVASGGYSWLNLTYSRTDYSWTDKGELPLGNGSDDPWGALHSLTLASDHQGDFDEQWGWFAGGSVGAAYEDELSGAWNVAGYGGAAYNWSEHTTLSFGLAASANELGLEIMPLLGVNWNYVGEDGEGWYAAVGIPNTMVGYSFSKAFSLTLQLDQDGTLYRLADDSDVTPKGYMEQNDMSVALAATWNPLENVSLTLAPSYHFDRSMTIYDRDGDEDKEYDLDNAAGAFMGVSVAF